MQSTANKDKSNRTSELLTIPRENFDRLLEHCKQESQHEEEAVDRGLAEIEANPKGGMTFEEFQKRIRLTPRGSQTEGDNKS